MRENIRLAFQGIWGHKLRSFLTMLGIIIGIAAIIAIVSTIKGTNEQIKENLIGSGNNVVTVELNRDGYRYDMTYESVPDGIRLPDTAALEALMSIKGVEMVSAYNERNNGDGVYFGSTQFNGKVVGADRDRFSVYGYAVKSGRGFTKNDYDRRAKVLLVDETAAGKLFAGVDPVGQHMELSGECFTVVGVVAPEKDFTPTISSISDYYMYTDRSSGTIYMPGTSWATVYAFDEPQNIALKVTNTDVMASVGKSAADVLTGVLVKDDKSGFDYRSENLLEQAEKLQSMSRSANMQLVWIAGISLVVGGIGVMNIMLVSVTERTAEIGLKKAIGAKKRRIRMQFLTEAAVLTALGGIIGVICGVGLAKLVSVIMGIPVAVSIPASLAAVVFSAVIGIVFGLLPAAKAANLSPIEALRRD